MRVVQLGPTRRLTGACKRTSSRSAGFSCSGGVSCEAINLTRFRRPDADGVHYPKNALQLLWILLRAPVDVLHLHIGGNLSTRLLALSLLLVAGSRVPAARTVLTFHSGGYPSSPEGRATNTGSSVLSCSGSSMR